MTSITAPGARADLPAASSTAIDDYLDIATAVDLVLGGLAVASLPETIVMLRSGGANDTAPASAGR